MKLKVITLLTGCIFTAGIARAQQNDKTIQINMETVFNARPVTTLTNGKLITWTEGIDGGGKGDGYLTQAAAKFNGDKEAHALPDDPMIPATASHPEILLHYSNNDSTNYQTRNIAGEGDFGFDVPHKKYNSLHLCFTSSEGPTTLRIAFHYPDGMDLIDVVIPDYYDDIPAGSARLSYLVHDLAKWGNKNNMTESDHHNIDVFTFKPRPNQELMRVEITKFKPGYLVFWGAAGVVVK